MKNLTRIILLLFVLGMALGSTSVYADPGTPGGTPGGGNTVGGGGGDPGVPLDGGALGLLLAGTAFMGIRKARRCP